MMAHYFLLSIIFLSQYLASLLKKEAVRFLFKIINSHLNFFVQMHEHRDIHPKQDAAIKLKISKNWNHLDVSELKTSM